MTTGLLKEAATALSDLKRAIDVHPKDTPVLHFGTRKPYRETAEYKRARDVLIRLIQHCDLPADYIGL